MNVSHAEIEREERAVSPVIATILMVAITVVLAGVLYVWANNLASEGTSTSISTLNTYTADDAAGETGPGADDVLLELQMTGKDDLAWSFIKITLAVEDRVYTCSVVAGDDCQIDQQAGENDNTWEPGEYLFLSEGTEDICNQETCDLRISVIYNGRTLAGDQNAGSGSGSSSSGGSSSGGGSSGGTHATSYKIVTIDDEGNTFYSSDSVNWNLGEVLPFNSGGYAPDVQYGANKFVTTSNDGNDLYFAYSSDGNDWNEVKITNSYYNYNSLTYGNNMFVSAGKGSGGWVTYQSSDGTSWTKTTDDVSSNSGTAWLSCTMYGEGTFVSIASSGAIYSTDGENWEDASNSPSGYIVHPDSCAYADGKFWAMKKSSGGSGPWIVAQSEDGTDWTSDSYDKISCSYSGCGVMKRLIHDGNRFVATDGGSGGGETDSRGAYSSDGETWTTFYNPMYTGATMAYVDGTYVIAGMTDDTVDGSQEHYHTIYTSTDLSNWTLRYKSDDAGCCGDKAIATSLD